MKNWSKDYRMWIINQSKLTWQTPRLWIQSEAHPQLWLPSRETSHWHCSVHAILQPAFTFLWTNISASIFTKVQLNEKNGILPYAMPNGTFSSSLASCGLDGMPYFLIKQFQKKDPVPVNLVHFQPHHLYVHTSPSLSFPNVDYYFNYYMHGRSMLNVNSPRTAPLRQKIWITDLPISYAKLPFIFFLPCI